MRALLENSAILEPHGFSFRRWLQTTCEELGSHGFRPPGFTTQVILDGRTTSLEKGMRAKLQDTFYMVGPTLALYMICDWQLWLWSRGQTSVFATFKLDSFHEQFASSRVVASSPNPKRPSPSGGGATTPTFLRVSPTSASGSGSRREWYERACRGRPQP